MMSHSLQKSRAVPSLLVLPQYLVHYNQPAVSPWSQPIPRQAPISAWDNPSTTTKTNTFTNQSKETSGRSSFFGIRPWEMILGSILLFLLVACILVPILIVNGFPSLSVTTVVSNVTIPSQCLAYTTNSDSTRSYTYASASVSCDNSSPFGVSPVWIRFAGAAGTMLANTIVPTSRCGTTITGYYTGGLPAAGETVQGAVCFNSVSDNCANQTTISVTNCNGFYIYYLPTVPLCNARYCTM